MIVFRDLLLPIMFVGLTMTYVHAKREISHAHRDPDYGLTVMEIIKARGYDVEEHKVTTLDDYILTMYRLPKSYKESQSNVTTMAKKFAVYLIHGLLHTSFTFVSNFRNQSLAFIMADAGYDVWLGNNRGTTWSNEHVTYSTDSDEYWDFSWQEMALYDMPAMINYVLNTTRQSSLSYVGHSEGTMQAFAGFSLNQKLAKKVSYFGALSPVAYVGHIASPLFRYLAKFHLDGLLTRLGIRTFGETNWLIQSLLDKYKCSIAGQSCYSIINAISGPSNNTNITRVPVYLSRTPVSTSVKNLVHFAQGVRENTFRFYDYGCRCNKEMGLARCSSRKCKNKEVYDAFEPPSFDLGAVKYPRMGFYRGVDDLLATSTDIAQLRAGLRNATILTDRSYKYNHIDFTWAYNANEVVYQDLVTQITKYVDVSY
ncbi:putative AB-hydrolase lipase domain, alpha/Beta hydrolase [Plasmopara halstedii]